ncbi:hypothetical protein [Mesorhizobium ciceri]|uniref:Uncharacterized protein n=1 Tax=Mesorhizobium ciceri biovar biserrulae (strain HAMBI 2942 / LMG 23838 / WSM1271) TaxID=765698 RepID=E8TAV6_MESCW|nr:hypothetical protein [Mesorhizobium ciceri]ADV11986.1 hypothetical protein Mesci_2855 [Mesorhizobium ciceri biovar biserrulae WSM1271]
MNRDLPTPAAILEELADKVAANIDRLAPVAFDGAFREMIRYHKFLLALNASRTLDGAAVNYAEVIGDAWNAPHQDWIRQYRRLFERAAGRIPDDDHFIRALAYTPRRLLPAESDPELSASIVRGILSLIPMLMHRLEDWVTKRTSLDTPKGEAASQRLALAGSDAKAYANVLPELVGAWEGLLQQAPTMYRWPETAGEDSDAAWFAFRKSWPLMWQHLSSTAYCLAVAVWNEDEAGTALFREALVRWPAALDHRLEDRAEFRHRRLLFPNILDLGWKEASRVAEPLSHRNMPPPTPRQLFAAIVRGAHDDVVLLTATLLLFWTINDKQASDIGGRTALALLRREIDDTNGYRSGARELSLQSLLFDLLRPELAGERYSQGSYAGTLDSLVASLDNMTERRVVPGRVFAPSTLHDREGLLAAVLAIMVAAVPEKGDGGVGQRIAELAADESLLPGGDRSLRNILRELRQYQTSLAQNLSATKRGTELLAPGRDAKVLPKKLAEIIHAAEIQIEAKRLERLKERPVDTKTLERIRLAIESALLHEPPEVPFFSNVQVVGVPQKDGRTNDAAFGGIEKAHLIDPPMDSIGSSFGEIFVSRSRRLAGQYAWDNFTSRPRVIVDVIARAEEEAFWRAIAELVAQVGPEPVLVVSRNAEGRALRHLLYSREEDRPNLVIERRNGENRFNTYIATVEGVDVYGADFPAGEAWLFSGQALVRIDYQEVGDGLHVTVDFEPTEELKGTLRVRIRQRFEWAQTPIFELHAPDPEEDEGN